MRQLTFFSILLIKILFFPLNAREEVVLTIPKSGTHYLKLLIENITHHQVIAPTAVHNFHQLYNKNSQTPNLVMGHCEPLILNHFPKKEAALLLIRDPRDVALSLIDYIDKCGLIVWPGLPTIISYTSWCSLSKKEKLMLILDRYYNERCLSVVSSFETAVELIKQKRCHVLKYESLNPEYNSIEELSSTIQELTYFLGLDIDPSNFETIINTCFRSSLSQTFNKGKAFRYLDEEQEILDLLESKLSYYIDYFEYSK